MKGKLSIGVSIIAIITALVTLGGCGSSSNNTGNDNNGGVAPALAAPLGMSLENLSAAEMGGAAGSGPDAPVSVAPEQSGLPGAEAAPLLVVPPPAPPWWLLLIPSRPRLREEAHLVAEAPAQLLYYVMTHQADMPACAAVTESGCPMDPSNPAGVCTVTAVFTAPCPITFAGPARNITLNLSGGLTRTATVTTPSSGPLAWDGVWQVVTSAANFQVTEPVTLKSVTFHGDLTRASDGSAAALPYTWKNHYVSDAAHNPVQLTNPLGDTLTVSGTRDEWVKPGASVDEYVDTYPTLNSVLLGATVHFHRNAHRTLALTGDTATVAVNGTLTNLDLARTWTRTGNYTMHRTNPTSVTINGTGQLTNPGGDWVQNQLINVVRDLDHPQSPVSGQAILTFSDGRIYTITFVNACLVNWHDTHGGGGQINLCGWDSYQP